MNVSQIMSGAGIGLAVAISVDYHAYLRRESARDPFDWTLASLAT